MATPDDVRFLYRTILRREPETESIVTGWASYTWQQMVATLLKSPEYQWTQFRGAMDGADPNKTFVFKTKYNFLMPVSLAEPLTIVCYMLNDYEPEESLFVLDHLEEGDHCVDVGARHGWFTGIMARKVGPKGRIYSFEPGPPICGSAQVAEQNCFDWIRCIRKGLSDAPGFVLFDSATLSLNTAGNDRIEVVRLDDELKARPKRISLIKADIEGAELLMIKGALDLIKKDRPVIVMELNATHLLRVSRVSVLQLFDFLMSLSYRCVFMSGEQCGRGAIEADSLQAIYNVAFLPVAKK